MSKTIPHNVRDWDNYFMRMAEEVSTMATCDRLHVGCVLVKDRRIIATGFNGSISGHDHCDEVGHLYNDEGRCIRTVHAEQNAILDCARRGISTDGATAYVTHEPCEHCTRSLAQAGVKEVYFKEAYYNKYNHHFNKDMKWVHLEEIELTPEGEKIKLRKPTPVEVHPVKNDRKIYQGTVTGDPLAWLYS